MLSDTQKPRHPRPWRIRRRTVCFSPIHSAEACASDPTLFSGHSFSNTPPHQHAPAPRVGTFPFSLLRRRILSNDLLPT